MLLKIFIILVFIYFYPVNFFSFPNNYQQVIPGAIANSLGGAAVAYSGEGEMAYYNPASIINIKKDGITVSANSYGIYFMMQKNRNNAGDNIITDLLHKSEIRVIPNTMAYCFILDKKKANPEHFLTLAIFVPSFIDIQGEDTKSDNINYRHHVKNWMFNYIYDLNLSYAYKVSDFFSFGFAIICSYGKLFQNDLLYKEDINNPINSKMANESYNFKTISLGSALGVLFSFSIINIGLSFKTKKIPVYSESQYTFFISGENPVFFNDEEVNYQRPWELYFGLAIKIIKNKFLIISDLKIYFAEKQNVAKSILLTITYERITILNYNIGLEWRINSNWALRSGFFTDRSASPKLNPLEKTDINNIKMMRYGIVAGLGYTGKNTEFIISMGYYWGSGEFKVRNINDFNTFGITDIKCKEFLLNVGSSYWFDNR